MTPPFSVPTVSRLLGQIETFIEAHAASFLAGSALCLAVLLLTISAHKTLSNDEALFVWSSAHSTLPGLWQGLVAGINQDPPLAHVLTHWSITILGLSPTAARVPAMAGFVVMTVFGFLFLKRRLPILYAVPALLIPLSTLGLSYATEARAYGVLLGFTALTLYFWDQAWREGARWMRLSLLALTLACTLATHFYGAFLLLPLLSATFWESLNGNRRAKSLLFALACGGLTLGAWLPIILTIRRFSTHHYAPASLSGLRQYYSQLFTDPLLTAVVFMIPILALWATKALSPSTPVAETPASLLDAALLLGFAAVPVFAVASALVVTKALAVQYLLFTIAGWTIGIPLMAAWIFGPDRLVAVALIVSFAVVGAINIREAMHFEFPDRYTADALRSFAALLPQDTTDVVVPKPNVFAALHFYAPPEVKQRIAYLADHDLAFRMLGYDTIDRTYEKLGELDHSYHVYALRAFVRTPKQFYLLSTDPGFTAKWCALWLPGPGVTTLTVRENAHAALLKVTLP